MSRTELSNNLEQLRALDVEIPVLEQRLKDFKDKRQKLAALCAIDIKDRIELDGLTNYSDTGGFRAEILIDTPTGMQLAIIIYTKTSAGDPVGYVYHKSMIQMKDIP
jgi:hypothetical protein